MTPDASGVDAVIDAVTAVFLVLGALMSLTATIGLLRFPDLMSRMHAATKPQVLGLFLLLAGIGLQMRQWWVWPVLVVAWIFQLLTVPVSAHMVGRAGYRTKHLHPELLSVDELEAVVRSAAAGREGAGTAVGKELDDVLGLGEAADGALGGPVGQDLDDGADARGNQGKRQG
jgi:multicomponent Na+:H+ antiporter subunit G